MTTIHRCIFACMLLTLPVYGARAVDIPAHPATMKPAPLVPLALQADYQKTADLPAVRLSAPDLSKAATSLDASKGVYETGRFVDPAPALESVGGIAGAAGWTDTTDGRAVALLRFEAPGAVGLRLGIAPGSVPSDATVYVWGSDDPRRAFPVEASGGNGGGGGHPREMLVWTPTAFGETVTLAVVFPGPARPETFSLEIPKVIWQYQHPAAIEKLAGSCNNDVTCFPAWSSTASGVTGLGVVSDGGALFCTGALVADTDPTSEIPYVLTANHCVGGQTGTRGASSLEFYWQFETASCDGTPPSAASVPRTTGGADYLGGDGGTGFQGGGNDFTLLRMRNTPPNGLTYIGTSTAVPPAGTPTVCVHHPRGEFKRISFGNLTNTANTHANDYHESTWYDGTTEPGSSGSPLFREDTQQIIGQLWGGLASCSLQSEPDYYGRFDVTFPQVENYLDPRRKPGFASATQSVVESAGTLTLPVTLSAAMNSVGGTVDYAVTSGTATPGTDYVLTSGTLTFNDTDTQQDITVSLVDNTRTEPDETLVIALSNPTGFIKLSGTVQITVTILDDDPDSDGDGISDADELSGEFGAVTNPYLADSDDDGLTDREELLGLIGPPTDPNEYDSDDDGLGDGAEIYHGLDPNMPDTEALSSLHVPWYRE